MDRTSKIEQSQLESDEKHLEVGIVQDSSDESHKRVPTETSKAKRVERHVQFDERIVVHEFFPTTPSPPDDQQQMHYGKKVRRKVFKLIYHYKIVFIYSVYVPIYKKNLLVKKQEHRIGKFLKNYFV